MKKLLTFSLIYISALLITTELKAQSKSVDYCVLLTATYTKSPAAITLNWNNNGKALNYGVYRKGRYETTWTTLQTGLSGTAVSYTDNTVAAGQEYEYQVIRNQSGNFQGFGYIDCSIELPVVHKRGSLLLLIEASLRDSLKTEIEQLSMDLAGDGWKVLHRYAPKDSSIWFVYDQIAEAAKWAENPLRSIYILGHVAVPYSGNYGQDNFYTVPPDGHPDHSGAWPADVWYGTSKSFYTDNISNDLSTREPNKNFPGDGRFDQIEIPGDINYHIGRVDLSNMPAFGMSEVQLLKRYLQKAHNYRQGITKTVNKGLIDENFDASIGAFASTAWRNFSAFFGPSNVVDRVENGVDYFTDLADSNYVFAYGTGGGSFTSAGGIGTTSDFVTKKGAVFNFLFGSYFGDWNVQNNFLRAPLASPENGLTSGWSGRPWWNAHHMAAGETIGFSTWVSQRNKNTYASTPFVNNIHIALMGDPSLRLYVMQPATNVAANAATGNTAANITWTASSETGVNGYYIYRSSTPYGTFEVINSTPVNGTTYTDNAPYEGTNYYMIRAVKLQQTPSGSFYNLSQGAFGKVDGLKGATASAPVQEISFHVYPNPASDVITIEHHAKSNTLIELTDVKGTVVKTLQFEPKNNFMQMKVNDLPRGVYWIKAGTSAHKVVLF